MADRPDDLDLVGLKDGVHLVLYDGLVDLKEKILYYLQDRNSDKRKLIAKTGMDFVRENHSCEIRVKQMTDFITHVTGIK